MVLCKFRYKREMMRWRIGENEKKGKGREGESLCRWGYEGCGRLKCER